MNQGKYIFSQLTQFLPKRVFDCLVDKYDGNKYVKSFTCWNHLLVMIFGQLCNRDGLRDLIVTLAPFRSSFHHLGFGKSVTRSNLSRANEVREVRIFQELAERMVSIARQKREAFFVVREKHKMVFDVVEDKGYNNPATGVMADLIIRFRGNKTKKHYPETLRRVIFYDKEGNRTFVFYTNATAITAEEVALLYKYRWRCELFFKWLKQHLRVKEFYGTSENAVKIQIYAAIIAYCLVAIVQRDMKLEMDTYDVLRILNVSLLTKMPLVDLLTKASIAEEEDNRCVQLKLEFED